MSRKYNIKWRQVDNRELAKAVKNFNAKIDRLQKKNPKAAYSYPQKVKVSELKDIITTRQDFNREINALKRFSRKGSEELVLIPGSTEGVKITRWQKNEMSRSIASINRKRADRLEIIMNTEATSRGEPLGYKVSDVSVGKQVLHDLQPLKPFTPSMSRHDAHKRLRTIRKERQSKYWVNRDKELRENFIQTLSDEYSISGIDDVITEIESMSIEGFLKIFRSEGNEFETNFAYPLTQDEQLEYLEELKAIWVK